MATQEIVNDLRRQLEQCVLCRIAVRHLPGGRVIPKDAKERLISKSGGVPEMYSVTRKLFSSNNPHVKRINKVINQFDNYRRRVSSPYSLVGEANGEILLEDLAGFRLVNRDILPDFYRVINGYREELQEAVKLFVANYTEICNFHMAQHAEINYPPVDQVALTNIGPITFYELSLTAGGDTSVYRAQMQTRIDQMLFSMAASVGEVCETVSDSLTTMIRAIHTRYRLFVPDKHPLKGNSHINVLEKKTDKEGNITATVKYQQDGKQIIEDLSIPAAEASGYTFVATEEVRRRISATVSENVAELFRMIEPIQAQLGHFALPLTAVLDRLATQLTGNQDAEAARQSTTSANLDSIIRSSIGDDELVEALNEIRDEFNQLAGSAGTDVQVMRSDVLEEILNGTAD